MRVIGALIFLVNLPFLFAAWGQKGGELFAVWSLLLAALGIGIMVRGHQRLKARKTREELARLQLEALKGRK